MNIVHKHVNKALQLRHHKHTGKLLAHKHTSYRVLFALLLLPILMLPLINNMNAYANEVLSVTATVPAPIPAGYPTIDVPAKGSSTTSDIVTVSGRCPVITPAIIIAIYRNSLLAGSVQCDSGGGYSVPISLEPGQNKLVATVVTITNGIGNSSEEMVVNKDTQQAEIPVALGQKEKVEDLERYTPLLRVLAKDVYVLLNMDGKGTWRGSIAGGTAPYQIAFNWGDGFIDRRTVFDNSEQTFIHDYEIVQPRALVISVTDATGVTTALRSMAIALDVKQTGLIIDKKAGELGVHPFIGFIHKNALTIYVSTVSALVFLWYIERGHHILSIREMMARMRHHPAHKP